jgi:hypothetical protein
MSEYVTTSTEESHYTIRVREVPHFDDISVKHVQTVPHRTVVEYDRSKHPPISSLGNPEIA